MFPLYSQFLGLQELEALKSEQATSEAKWTKDRSATPVKGSCPRNALDSALKEFTPTGRQPRSKSTS